MAGAGKKTFTAGEVLTASDVNTYLMEQSVMVFGGTAARSSAIPTPSEGMTSYRTDTQQIESYDGAEWRGMSGLQLVKKQTIGSAVASVTVTDAFSATYDSYKIIVNGGASSGADNIRMVLGASTTGYYQSLANVSYSAVTQSLFTANNGANWPFVGAANTDGIKINIDVLNPFLAKSTVFHGPYVTLTSAGNMSGLHQVSTSFTAFTLSVASPATMTGGTIYVYGYGT
jgi:hypothetical protein